MIKMEHAAYLFILGIIDGITLGVITIFALLLIDGIINSLTLGVVLGLTLLLI